APRDDLIVILQGNPNSILGSSTMSWINPTRDLKSHQER
ncbi:MAG: hypothetical protein ACI93T_000447, partial [Porticoccaceae bacterium]